MRGPIASCCTRAASSQPGAAVAVHCRRQAARCSAAHHAPAGTPCSQPAPRQLLLRQLRQEQQRQRRLAQRASSSASGSGWDGNPQNVDEPLMQPSPQLTPRQAVEAQLDALARNDEPWVNHGLQTAYEFGEDIGGLEPSSYFGYRKDLYHFDHFMGIFQNAFPGLVNNTGYTLEPASPHGASSGEASPPGGSAPAAAAAAAAPAAPLGEECVVRATVVGAKGAPVRVAFRMKVKGIGSRKGSWMVKSLVQEADET